MLHFSGRVQRGEGIASQLGCPTANLGIEEGAVIPPLGVYVGQVDCRGNVYPCLICVNAGKNQDSLKIEVHFLDERMDDLDGVRLHVYLLGKIRNLVLWENMQQMASLVKADVERARAWFQERGAFSAKEMSAMLSKNE